MQRICLKNLHPSTLENTTLQLISICTGPPFISWESSSRDLSSRVQFPLHKVCRYKRLSLKKIFSNEKNASLLQQSCDSSNTNSSPPFRDRTKSRQSPNMCCKPPLPSVSQISSKSKLIPSSLYTATSNRIRHHPHNLLPNRLHLHLQLLRLHPRHQVANPIRLLRRRTESYA